MKRFFKIPFPYIAAILLMLFYFGLPWLAKQIISDPVFSKSASLDAKNIARYIQHAMFFPISEFLGSSLKTILAFPYFLFVCYLIQFIYLRTKKLWKYGSLSILALIIFLYIFPNSLLLLDNDKASISYGSTSNGRIENSKRMYLRGTNYKSYSFAGYLLGRTFVHNKVKQTIVDAYKNCETTCPKICFVLGETGKRKGGRFLPHRTHRNGLSVDFMSPLLKGGKPYQTNHIFNRWGYGLDFDNTGKNETYQIDYETMAQHILAIKKAAAKNGLKIQKIIFDPVLRPQLIKTNVGAQIKNLAYTKNRVVVRHDDHYHIDFAVK